jgi:hypothetical protein
VTDNVFAPEGYEQMLPNWPAAAKPWGSDNAKLHSDDDLARGAVMLEQGLDVLARRFNLEGSALAEMWRGRWDIFPPDIYGKYNKSQAPVALYTEQAFQWFKTAPEAEELLAFVSDPEVRESIFGKQKNPQPELGIHSAIAAVVRTGLEPKEFMTAVQIHGAKGVHRMGAALRFGGLTVLLDEAFPIRYMAEVPAKWTGHLDVVAKCAWTGMPPVLVQRFFEMKLSADDVDYLCANVAAEYIDVMLQP